MGNYKRTQHSIIAPDGSFISEGGSGWDKYLQFIADGGQVDEAIPVEDISTRLSNEIKSQYDKLANSKVQAIQSLRRNINGNATQKDLDRLNKLDIIEASYENLLAWINDPSRTREELESFDPGEADWGV